MNPRACLISVLIFSTSFSVQAGIVAVDAVSNFYNVDTGSAAATNVGATGQVITGLAYDSDNSTYFGVTDADNLYSISTATGAATLVGGLGINGAAYGMTYDAGTSTMYLTASVGVNGLYSVNTSTGAASLIGGSASGISALAFGGGVLYGLNRFDDSLYTINTTTGAVTLVGATGFNVASQDGLSFDDSGTTLYMSNSVLVDDLYSINTSTGAATYVGDFSGTTEGQIGGLAPGSAGGGAASVSLASPLVLYLAGGTLMLLGSLRRHDGAEARP